MFTTAVQAAHSKLAQELKSIKYANIYFIEMHEQVYTE